MNKKTEKKGNICGILSLCLGWFIPLVGLILGIVALARKEDNKTLGIIGIILSVVFWALWTLLFVLGGML